MSLTCIHVLVENCPKNDWELTMAVFFTGFRPNSLTSEDVEVKFLRPEILELPGRSQTCTDSDSQDGLCGQLPGLDHMAQCLVAWAAMLYIDDLGGAYISDYKSEGWQRLEMQEKVKSCGARWTDLWLLLDNGKVQIITDKTDLRNRDCLTTFTRGYEVTAKGGNSDSLTLSHLSAGEGIVLGCSEDGRCGELECPTEGDPDGPQVYWAGLSLSGHVTQVSCGKEHAVLLTHRGQVFSWGSGSRGQLGHGTTESWTDPTLLGHLDGLTMRSVAAGGWHSMAVSDIGDLYAWGWNESGQLGLPCKTLREKMSVSRKELLKTNRSKGDSLKMDSSKTDSTKLDPSTIIIPTMEPIKESSTNREDCDEEPYCREPVVLMSVPCLVEFPHEVTVTEVSCGSRHSAVVTDTGDLFTTGWNEYGQLGLGDTSTRDMFTMVTCLTERHLVVDRVTCGCWGTVIWASKAPDLTAQKS